MNRYHESRKYLTPEAAWSKQTQVGPWTVRVYRCPDGEYVYRVHSGRWTIPCITTADERNFPKRAARVGTMLVAQLTREANRIAARTKELENLS